MDKSTDLIDEKWISKTTFEHFGIFESKKPVYKKLHYVRKNG